MPPPIGFAKREHHMAAKHGHCFHGTDTKDREGESSRGIFPKNV